MALRDGVNAHLGDEVEVGVPVLNLRANDEHACVDTKCRGQAENEYNGYSREGDRDSVCMCECVSVCVCGGGEEERCTQSATQRHVQAELVHPAQPLTERWNEVISSHGSA